MELQLGVERGGKTWRRRGRHGGHGHPHTVYVQASSTAPGDGGFDDGAEGLSPVT